jgi:hypothetical protein
MTNRIEDDVRELFGEHGSRFDMDRSLPSSVVHRGRRRAWRRTSTVAIVAVGLAGAAALAVRSNHTPTPGSRAAGEGTAVYNLVKYVDPGSDASADDEGPALQQYVDCMRGQGYDLPDPTRTDDGWAILVPPGSIDRTDVQWREATFVTCRLEKFLPRPPGDLILGFPDSAVTAYRECLHQQGFDLPEPRLDSDGNYRFDLRDSGIDTNSDAWARAAFVTCSPTGN